MSRMAEPAVIPDVPAVPIASLRERIGEEIGVSEWMIVDQSRIDVFADVTEDRQWIHIDPEAATASPFGGTIAHGFLSLSLLAPMSYTALPAVENLQTGVNYGFNNVRFLAPVRSGKRVRGHFLLKDLVERSPGGWQMTVDASVEIEGESKPALVAEWMFLYYVG
jgi:acyl dehydratase